MLSEAHMYARIIYQIYGGYSHEVVRFGCGLRPHARARLFLLSLSPAVAGNGVATMYDCLILTVVRSGVAMEESCLLLAGARSGVATKDYCQAVKVACILVSHQDIG